MTAAILAWSGTALAAMIGEWRGAPEAAAARAQATRVVPDAARQASAWPAWSAHAAISLI